MGSVSFYGVYSFQHNILEQDITEKLESAAESQLDKLDRMFYERLNGLDILSASPVFLAQSSSRKQMNRELEKFLSRYSQYNSVSYYDMNRVKLASVGPSKLVGKQHARSEYWPAIYAGRDHIVNVSISESLHTPTIHFVDRVIDNHGKSVGVLVARAQVAELYGLMDGKKDIDPDAAKYKVAILDQDGTILYSNHNKEAILNAVDEDFGLIKEAIPAVRTVSSLTQIHQEAHSAEKEVLMVFAKEQGYRNFKGNGWILK